MWSDLGAGLIDTHLIHFNTSVLPLTGLDHLLIHCIVQNVSHIELLLFVRKRRPYNKIEILSNIIEFVMYDHNER